MFIAHQLKDNNICEYLLYMWQVEDTIRAYDCNAERIAAEYLPAFQLEGEMAKKEAEWWGYLAQMMREEEVVQKGHLQINKGTLSLLTDKHQEMLHDPKQPFYSAAYYKALPFIVELRAKGDNNKPELETCLDALYGVMLLKAQKREVSRETMIAIQHISHLLAMLSDAYKKEKLQ